MEFVKKMMDLPYRPPVFKRAVLACVVAASAFGVLLESSVDGQQPAGNVASEVSESDSLQPESQLPELQQNSIADTVDVQVLKDLTYATVDDVTLLCDVYLPVESASENADKSLRPAVLVIHGGGWAIGDKWSVSTYARGLAERGIVAVSMNYRHAPRYKFPAQIDDVRNALVWINKHAEEYRIDPERLGMFGYSAGGHLSCMIGTLVDANWETLEKTTDWSREDPRWQQLPKLCGVVGGGAPCDFRDLPIDNTAIAYFLGGSRRERPETYKAASPAEHASPGDVPMLFIHGTQDAIVPIASSRILYEAQLKVGVPSRFLALDGPGHMLTFINQQTKTATIEFLTQILLPSEKPAQ